MGRHAVRGAISAWLSLILLQAVVRPGGAVDSGRWGGFITDATGLVNRALSAKVAAIPDRRTGAGSGATDTSQAGYITPDQVKAGAETAANLPAAAAIGQVTGGPSIGQYVAGGGLPAVIGTNPAVLDPSHYPIPAGFGWINPRAVR